PLESRAIGFVGEVAGTLRRWPLIAPGKTPTITALRRIFPFFLSWKSVGAASCALCRLAIEPVHKCLCVFIADAHRRLIIAVEFESAIRSNMVLGSEPPKFGVCLLVHRHEKAATELKQMLLFMDSVLGIGGERSESHRMIGGWNSDQPHPDRIGNRIDSIERCKEFRIVGPQ